jgi:inosose dehydratase
VKVLLDVAHYQQGGGDPVTAVRKYADRILLPAHQGRAESAAGQHRRSDALVPVRRAGPRQGRLEAVFAALNEVKFRGWAIVELDAVPDKARTPKESAIIAKTYLEQLGFTV